MLVSARPTPVSGGHPTALSDLTFGVHIWGRHRSAELLAPEVALSIRWRHITFRGGYQVPVNWNLEGRQVQVQGLHVGLGWTPVLWRPKRWLLRAHLMLVAERSWAARRDVPGASVHGFWEYGGAAGISIARNVSNQLTIALQAEGGLYPITSTVRVPDGPAIALDSWSVRWGMCLHWQPWDS
jgi:hypothetical protein